MRPEAPVAVDRFYADMPVFAGFDRIMDPALYRPLPDGWVIGLTDVVASTRAIAEGRFKAVNIAGAAAIAAVANGRRGLDFPFAFGGDGASFAVAAADEAAARAALAATVVWAREELGLELRAALLPVAAVRAQGLDARVARFAPSPNVTYAMFAGGGLAWAEREMKRGRFVVTPAAPGTRPDLTGLSCRWAEMPSARGVVLSLIVAPTGADERGYRALVEEILRLVADAGEAGRPLPEGGPQPRWVPGAIELEARISRRAGGSLAARRLALGLETLFAWLVLRLGRRLGRFDPVLYRRDVADNADFRKYEDGLRMTLDCTPALADRVEARLAAAAAAGIARYGLHRQGAALMTCLVPSPLQRDHIHFIDGAAGGYTAAARAMKATAT